MKEIKEFSKAVGSDIINFPGSGGNISMKLGNSMYIKASGYKISDINDKNTLSEIDIGGFIKANKGKEILNEDELSSIIESNNISNLKSSIETAFHILLDKYVIHSHNAYINVLLCMKNSDIHIKKIFGNKIDIIEYFSPGLGLYNCMKGNKNKSIIFLKNHGIILHGNTGFDDLYKKLNEIESVIIQYFKLNKFKILKNKENLDKHIFPDTIVINSIDIYSSHYFITNEILRIGGKINYLTLKQIDYIKSMATEKYRKELFNNAL